MKRTLVVLLTVGAMGTCFAATPSTDVGTLSIAQGTVLVNDGKQFVTAHPGQAIRAGDRIMVMSGAKASIQYGNGQTKSLVPGSLLDVGNFQSVTGGQKKIGPMYAQVGSSQDNCEKGSHWDNDKKKCVADVPAGETESGGIDGEVAAGLGAFAIVGIAIGISGNHPGTGHGTLSP